MQMFARDEKLERVIGLIADILRRGVVHCPSTPSEEELLLETLDFLGCRRHPAERARGSTHWRSWASSRRSRRHASEFSRALRSFCTGTGPPL